MREKETLLQKCLKNLTELPDIQVSATPESCCCGDVTCRVSTIDGKLIIQRLGHSINYIYSIKPNITGTNAELVIIYLKHLQDKLGKKTLLITDYLSNPAIDKFTEQNIEFIDAAGNIYLNNLIGYILIRGKPRLKEKLSSGSKITANTLQIVYTLLKSPSLLKAPNQELANAAGVSNASVGKTLKNLYELGYLQRQKGGSYRITNYIKLLERWEMGYAETLRPKFLLGTFTAVGDRKFSSVAKSIIEQAKEDNFLIGGELGAAIATSHLYPQRATLHILENYRLIAAKLRLKPSPQGEIIFLQQFGRNNAWSDRQDKPIADPLLIHAELLLENNERLWETAEVIFSNYIGERLQSA